METLIFTPSSEKDFFKFNNFIEDSDFYAEVNEIEQYFSFDEENPDALENELSIIINEKNINGHFATFLKPNDKLNEYQYL